LCARERGYACSQENWTGGVIQSQADRQRKGLTSLLGHRPPSFFTSVSVLPRHASILDTFFQLSTSSTGLLALALSQPFIHFIAGAHCAGGTQRPLRHLRILELLSRQSTALLPPFRLERGCIAGPASQFRRSSRPPFTHLFDALPLRPSRSILSASNSSTPISI
jgi:hypothetical protein